jgi:hypothetical protein
LCLGSALADFTCGSPTTGKHLCEIETHFLTTIKELKAQFAKEAELSATAMVFARGKMGQRISDSSENLYGDSETVWACGYVDGQEVGYMCTPQSRDRLSLAAREMMRPLLMARAFDRLALSRSRPGIGLGLPACGSVRLRATIWLYFTLDVEEPRGVYSAGGMCKSRPTPNTIVGQG